MAGLDAAVKAALKGPENKGISIRGHGFNVKKADRKVVSGETHVWGQISHKLRWQPDDQVFYEIVIAKKKIVKVTRSIKGGTWKKVAGKVATVAGGWIGVPLPPETAEKAYEIISDLVVGDWIEAGDVIIAAVALESV